VKYRFESSPTDYSDLASGSVLRSAPGRPAFPVRLASELFQRAFDFWASEHDFKRPCTLYDPCCGAAYGLTTLKLLHWELIRHVIGSDIDQTALDLAKLNLGLLEPEGLRARTREISALVQQYGKASHIAALDSAERLLSLIENRSAKNPAQVSLFRADALRAADVVAGLGGTSADLVFVDLPYGKRTHWVSEDEPTQGDTIGRLLDSIRSVTAPGAVIVIVTHRSDDRAMAVGFKSLKQLKTKGHRHASILRRTD
jgi:SAM-dependent methyltransferase